MKHFHIVGIGGSGMSAIAKVLLESGYSVSGSDQALSPAAEALAKSGADVDVGHAADNVGEAEAVIISSAVPADNVEIVEAQARGLPVYKRADFLGQMME